MRIFKRFTFYVLSVALVVVLASAALVLPWIHTPTDGHDQALRSRLAGQIDTLIIGQSYAMNGVVPAKLDEKLGTRTYNLSGSLMPIYGQQYMIEKELARNPVRHVLIEITPDTFTSDETQTYGNGDSYIVARLDSMAERLEYLLRHVQMTDWPNIYARSLLQSMRSAAYRLLGKAELIDESQMGFIPLPAKDVSLAPGSAAAQIQSMAIFHNPLEENMRKYESLIEACQRAGCDVTIFYTPVSHGKVWQLYDQDTFRTWANELAGKYGVPLFDFNLLRSRYELFTDEASFSDNSHLSGEGAQVFSGVMADVLARSRAGEDVSPLFYANYEDAIRSSIYKTR
ncbi:MAG: SGNH/GDSL hydrolase family protein [Clostridia bacterium]|nr:SGNH/GDSL hydrolase family protein [Clostridia bacterium]